MSCLGAKGDVVSDVLSCACLTGCGWGSWPSGSRAGACDVSDAVAGVPASGWLVSI